MDRESIRRRFLEGSSVYPPMDIFEPPDGSCDLAFLRKCEAHANRDKDAFYLYLGKLMDACDDGLDFAFFGNSIYGLHFPMDIDLLLFTGSSYTGSRPYSAIRFLHESHLYENTLIPNSRPPGYRFLLSHALLMFPGSPSAFARGIVEEARAHISQAPFLQGGVGDIIAYAAFKAVSRHEYAHLRDSGILRGMRFKIDWQSFDLSSMRSGPISPVELLSQVKKQMKGMDDGSLDALTGAALRRLRVRRPRREDLAKRFISELRAYRAPCR